MIKSKLAEFEVSVRYQIYLFLACIYITIIWAIDDDYNNCSNNVLSLGSFKSPPLVLALPQNYDE